MSNIYRSDFNVGINDSLFDILQAGPKYFEKKNIHPLDGQAYDFDI